MSEALKSAILMLQEMDRRLAANVASGDKHGSRGMVMRQVRTAGDAVVKYARLEVIK